MASTTTAKTRRSLDNGGGAVADVGYCPPHAALLLGWPCLLLLEFRGPEFRLVWCAVEGCGHLYIYIYMCLKPRQ